MATHPNVWARERRIQLRRYHIRVILEFAKFQRGGQADSYQANHFQLQVPFWEENEACSLLREPRNQERPLARKRWQALCSPKHADVFSRRNWHLDLAAAAGDLHLQHKNSAAECGPCCFALVCIVSITDPTRIRLLSFFLHNRWDSLLSAREVEADGCFQMGVLALGSVLSEHPEACLAMYGSSAGTGIVSRETGTNTDPGVSRLCFCLKIHIDLWGLGQDCVPTSVVLNKRLGISVVQKEQEVWTLAPSRT